MARHRKQIYLTNEQSKAMLYFAKKKSLTLLCSGYKVSEIVTRVQKKCRVIHEPQLSVSPYLLSTRITSLSASCKKYKFTFSMCLHIKLYSEGWKFMRMRNVAGRQAELNMSIYVS